MSLLTTQDTATLSIAIRLVIATAESCCSSPSTVNIRHSCTLIANRLLYLTAKDCEILLDKTDKR